MKNYRGLYLYLANVHTNTYLLFNWKNFFYFADFICICLPIHCTLFFHFPTKEQFIYMYLHINKIYPWELENNAAGKALALHAANPGLIPRMSYNSLIKPEVIPECRVKSNLWALPCVAQKNCGFFLVTVNHMTQIFISWKFSKITHLDIGRRWENYL